MNDIVPRDKLTKQALQGVFAVAGGVGSLVLSGLGTAGGIVIGGVLTVVGLAFAGSKHERTAGVVTTVVGAATLLSGILPGLRHLVHGFEVGTGIILLGVGAYSLIKFFRGLKSRS